MREARGAVPPLPRGARVTARCETCRWSAEGARAGGPVLECHRSPPSREGWPAVRPTDLCGEHTPDGWKGLTAEETIKARQIVAAQDFFRRLARVGRG